MTRIFICSLVLASVVVSSCNDSKTTDLPVSDQAILIHNVNIIDVNDGSILQNMALLMDSGMIQSIGPYATLKPLVSPENAIDAEDKFMIPGLWDMHVHIEGQDLIEDNFALFPVFVAFGITTVRDMASDIGEQVLTWREEINQNKFLGPQIFTAGRKLEGVNSVWKGDLEIANESELEQMLDQLEVYEVDLVKITDNTLSGTLFLKSVHEAEKRGFLVSGHVPLDLTIHELVGAGFSSIEHASYLLRLGSDEIRIAEQVRAGKMTNGEANDFYISNFNQDTAINAYRRLGKTRVAITPTLIGGRQLAYLDEDDHSNDPFLDYLTSRFTSNYQWRMDRIADDTPAQKQGRKDRYILTAQQLRHIQDAGMTILAGSDAAALNTFVYPALALHEELVLFQTAGLTPVEILQSATINGAEFMGELSTMGSIEIGKQADLVLLNSNPLVDIKSTQDIYAVINNGLFLSRADLDSILKHAKRQKMELDRQRDSE